jgi:hypothetical protein
MANPPPISTPVDDLQGCKLKLSYAWSRWFNYLTVFLGNVVDYTQVSMQSPISGFSITMGDSAQVLQLTPAGVLATGTVILPANPANGQAAEILSTQTITAFTLSPNTGQTINNAPTALTAGTGVALYYNKPNSTWYRRY